MTIDLLFYKITSCRLAGGNYITIYTKCERKIVMSNNNTNLSDITKNMGERLVMFQLMKYKKWDVDFVDYVGADLIALDKEKGVKYAISVKTKNHETDGHTCSLFTDKDAEYLREFAADMSDNNSVMIPLVAFVIIKLDGTICTFIVNLDDLDDLRNEGDIVKYSSKDGYYLIYGSSSNPNNLRTERGRENYEINDKEKFGKVLFEKRISHIISHLTDINISESSYDFFREWDTTNYTLTNEMRNKQQGDFGENYLTWRARDFNMRAFLVKSEGADIVLQNIKHKDKKYAVSVKTFTKTMNNDGYEFEKKNVIHLKNYAKKWGMTPIFSLIIIINENNIKKVIYNINMTLEYLEKSANDNKINWINNCKGTNNSGGYRITWNDLNDLSENLNNNKEVLVTKMTIE